MTPLTIIAKLKAKPGKEQEVYDACHALLAPTHAEEGCINYDMHRSVEDPAIIIFYENWTTRELFFHDGRWWLEDLGSRNGTYLGSAQVTDPVPVPTGVPIQLGQTVLELQR